MMMVAGGEDELPHNNGKRTEPEEFRLPPNDNPELRLKVGQQLGAIRRSRGTSQEQAAKDIKISRPHLSNIEQGRARTDWAHLTEIARYYNLGIEEVIEAAQREGAKPPTRGGQNNPPSWYIGGARERQTTLTNHEALLINIWRALKPEHQQRVAKLLTSLATTQFAEKGQ